MRVLVVTPWFPCQAHPGSGIFNLRDVELLAQDHEVRVIHLIRPDWYRGPEPGDDGADTGIPITRVRFSARAPGDWRAARAAIRREMADADVLHTMAFPALVPLVGMRIPTPWVHTEHWSQLGSATAATTLTKLLRPMLKRPDQVVAVSDSLANTVARWARHTPAVIANAVPLPQAGTHAAVAEGLRTGPPATTAAAAERARVIGVGGILPRKGPLLAVDALAKLRESGIDAELHWAGVGDDEAAMRARVTRLGLDDHVTLLGQLTRDELEAALLAAHAFLLPTEGETFGVAIAEALGCGLPVVTTGVGGHEAFLRHFPTAQLVERDPDALAAALRSALTDPVETPAQTAVRARDRFAESTRRVQYAEVYRAASERRVK